MIKKGTKELYRGWYLSAILIIFVISIYLYFIYIYSLNLPIGDDYDTVFLCINQVVLLMPDLIHNFKSVAHSFLAQQNEHRVLTLRMFAYAQNFFFHGINFRGLILFGNFLKILLFFLILRFGPLLRPWCYVVMALFFFQLLDWEAAYWVTAGVTIYSVLLFAFLAFWMLTKSENYFYFILALLFTFLSAFSIGNGLIVPLIGLLILWERRHYRLMGIYFVFFLLLLTLYFHGYIHPLASPKISIDVSALKYYLILLGHLTSFPISFGLYFFGIVGLIVFIVFYIKFKDFSKNIIFYYLVFILLTVALAAITRNGFGLEQALSSRYQIYPIIFFTSLYGFWASKTSRGKLILISALMVIISVINFKDGIQIQKDREQIFVHDMVICKNGQISGLAYPDQERAWIMLQESKQLSVYNIYNHLPVNIRVLNKCAIKKSSVFI